MSFLENKLGVTAARAGPRSSRSEYERNVKRVRFLGKSRAGREGRVDARKKFGGKRVAHHEHAARRSIFVITGGTRAPRPATR